MINKIDYLIQLRNKIGKRIDKEQNLLESGREYCSDKVWFKLLDEYETLENIIADLQEYELAKKVLKLLTINDKNELRFKGKNIVALGLLGNQNEIERLRKLLND